MLQKRGGMPVTPGLGSQVVALADFVKRQPGGVYRE